MSWECAHLEEARSAGGNPELEHVKRRAQTRVPLGPEIKILAKRSVATVGEEVDEMRVKTIMNEVIVKEGKYLHGTSQRMRSKKVTSLRLPSASLGLMAGNSCAA
jgi:hypothetical protein